MHVLRTGHGDLLCRQRKDKVIDTMDVNSLPRRGRPYRTAEQQDQLRRQLLDAAAAVYAEQGFRGTTVARIAAAAGVSKPTFYTCFANVEAVMGAIAEDARGRLMNHLLPTFSAENGLLEQIDASIAAYLDWADEIGQGLRVFHLEQHDPGSPAGRLRVESTARVSGLLLQLITTSGRPAPSPEALALLLAGLQSACYEYQENPDADRRATHTAMLRLAVALTGTSDDLRDLAALLD
ncbi:TetR/AcrR family transcriptional regulator [Pseudonocardiaceae bacterium YIM PH 21723]|nr:TetR/AcrR family transcriptional regulator [Pseudonocardiaceae bacterium YIM PH 21723]